MIDYNKISMFYMGGHSYTTALTVESNSVVSNNLINGSVSVLSSNVTNNVISGGGPFTDWVGRPEDATSALEANGNCTISQNVLWSNTGGYGLLTRRVYSYNYNSSQSSYSGYVVVSNNNIKNKLRIASDALAENNQIDGGVQVGDIYISAFNEINYGYGDSVLRGNIITGYGIFSSYSGGSTIIQGNLIKNVTDGISLNSQALVIENNTIMNTSTAITLSTGTPSIRYNNFLGYTQNSIKLYNNPSRIDAANNYWDSTDVSAINLTVHDFKYDLNLGVVNISPILAAPNSNAPSASYSLQLPTDTSSQPIATTNPTANPTSTAEPTTNPTGTTQPSANPTDSGTSSSPDTSSAPNATPTIPEFPSWPAYILLTLAGAVALIYMAARRTGLTPKSQCVRLPSGYAA